MIKIIKTTYGNVLQLIYKTIAICYYVINMKIFSVIYRNNENNELC